MVIGSMNHPGRDVQDEIERIARLGFNFIDLTLEPPLANAQNIDVKGVASVLKANKLGIVGHTAYYLPLGHSFESVRRAAVNELKLCVETFAKLGAEWMNIHPDFHAPLYEHQFIVDRNLHSIRELLETARQFRVGLMLENLPGSFNSVRQVGELLDPLPEVGLHLDLGHANLLVPYNTTEELLATYGTRVRHVHLHDNKGGSADLHLPLGAGVIDTSRYVRALQAIGYDGTITLEVFTPDTHFLCYSRDILRRIWDECGRSSPVLHAAAK